MFWNSYGWVLLSWYLWGQVPLVKSRNGLLPWSYELSDLLLF